MLKYSFSIITMLLLPVFFAWWLFIPFAFLFIFFSEYVATAVTVAFILDLFYIGAHPNLPILSFVVILFLILRFCFKDQVRVRF